MSIEPGMRVVALAPFIRYAGIIAGLIVGCYLGATYSRIPITLCQIAY